MTATTETNNPKQLSLAHTVRALLGHYLGNRKLLALLAVAVVGAGLAFNWGWLVTVGIAPILLALAPCAAMCALGLCMSKMGGKSCPGTKEEGAARAPADENSRTGNP